MRWTLDCLFAEVKVGYIFHEGLGTHTSYMLHAPFDHVGQIFEEHLFSSLFMSVSMDLFVRFTKVQVVFFDQTMATEVGDSEGLHHSASLRHTDFDQSVFEHRLCLSAGCMILCTNQRPF